MNHATVDGKPVKTVCDDQQYWNEEFISKVQKRGGELMGITGKPSAGSAALAVCDHMHDWWYGTSANEHAIDSAVSMGVISDGNTYGVPEGLMFSFPVSIAAGGEWTIMKDLEISEFS